MAEVIRYDKEFSLAECVKSLLAAKLSSEIQATHPVVSWFDPMAWNAGANRIVALCTDGSTQSTSKANSDMVIEVGVKTVFSQAKAQDDYNLHRSVTDSVRAYLAKEVDTLIGLLNEYAEKGFNVYYCDDKRDYSSDSNGSNLYSSVKFGVKCISVREEQ